MPGQQPRDERGRFAPTVSVTTVDQSGQYVTTEHDLPFPDLDTRRALVAELAAHLDTTPPPTMIE